jgi:2-isopropylmalate synthase
MKRPNRNIQRYSPFAWPRLADRRWPDSAITTAPRWLTTDLRDGNQALANPMGPVRKLAMFDMLTSMGYREIEVGFPAASQDDYNFVRMLAEECRIPDQVRISVLVPAKEDLIYRTIESLNGISRATIHLYNATSPQFRSLVLGMTSDECIALAVEGTQFVIKYAEMALKRCDLGFEYSPELFTETEQDFALEICEAVMDTWEPDADREIILNFPATVERGLPVAFADQIEWMDRHLSRREYICLSVHPHNDRGTGVAAAELALLAGAQRIEGCLFGNGERAGNVDLITLGLNLYSSGIDPGINFSDIPAIRKVVEECTELPVHPRHPYAGDLVHTAFSGSHQDAIKKGFDSQARQAAAEGISSRELPWRIPYLPIDPRDIGRNYESIVRITSQSGKGGVAYIMDARHGMNLPAGLRVDFALVVQAAAEHSGELSPAAIERLFVQEYMSAPAPIDRSVNATLYVQGAALGSDEVRSLGAELAAWNIDVYMVHRIGLTRREEVIVYAECMLTGPSVWGVGRSRDVIEASRAAVGSAFPGLNLNFRQSSRSPWRWRGGAGGTQ